MSGIFYDTVFASIVRAVLGPAYFSHTDEMDPFQVYVHWPQSSSTIGTALYDPEDPFNVQGRRGSNGVYPKQERSLGFFWYPEGASRASISSTPTPLKGKGTDSMLVTWRGPDDPEVRSVLSFVPHRIDVFCEESNELVASQEILGHVSTMLHDFLGLLRWRSLYCCYPRRIRAISCQPGRLNPWAYIIPARVWDW